MLDEARAVPDPAAEQWAGLKEPWTFHERLDGYYYAWAAKAQGLIPTILAPISASWAAADARCCDAGRRRLMGMAVATSCLLGPSSTS